MKRAAAAPLVGATRGRDHSSSYFKSAMLQDARASAQGRTAPGMDAIERGGEQFCSHRRSDRRAPAVLKVPRVPASEQATTKRDWRVAAPATTNAPTMFAVGLEF